MPRLDLRKSCSERSRLWCGGIRAEASAKNGLVDQLHICEIREDRLKEVADLTNPTSATLDYKDLLKNDDIHAIMISTTPESTHYPIAKETLEAGKHLLLEKPISRTLTEADELISLAEKNKVQFTIGYSQRFRSKYAYVREKFIDGTLGEPVSVLIYFTEFNCMIHLAYISSHSKFAFPKSH